MNMKKIPGFPDYKISRDGQVYSVRYNRFLKLTLTAGYLYVCLFKNKKRYPKRVHRLLLETYIGLCPDGMECCHNDGNPLNNRLENLRWDTRSNNVKDSVKHGTHINCRGENHSGAKLNELQVRIIHRLLEFGKLAQREIAEIFNVNQTLISHIKLDKTWKHI